MKCLICENDTHAFETSPWVEKNVCKGCTTAIVMATLACFNEMTDEPKGPLPARLPFPPLTLY